MSSVKFNTALSNKLQVYPTPGRLLKASIEIDDTAASDVYYIQCFNLADIPVNGTALTATNTICAVFAAKHTTGTPTLVNLDFVNDKTNGNSGFEFNTALTIAASTTQFTITAATNIFVATAYYETI